MRSFMTILLASAFAMGFAMPAEADVCSDYNHAVALNDATDKFLNERLPTTASGTPEYRALIDLELEAADRLDAAQRAVLANLNSEVGVTTIHMIYALRASTSKIWNEATAWGESSEHNRSDSLMAKLVSIRIAITQALEAAFDRACR